MVKPNNRRKDPYQLIASKWLIEFTETWAKWLFYEVVAASQSSHLLPRLMICLK